MAILMSMAAATAAALLLTVGCDSGPRRPARDGDNPIATCASVSGNRVEFACVSLRLVVKHLESTAASGTVTGSLLAENRCHFPVGLLAAPIDTRLWASEAYEQFRGSSYGRFSVYEQRTRSVGLEDIGTVVRVLPHFVIVPPHTTRAYPFGGNSESLHGLRVGEERYAELCTFAAPADLGVRPSATLFAIDASIARHDGTVRRRCPVTLRPSATLICSPPVPVQVSSVTTQRPR